MPREKEQTIGFADVSSTAGLESPFVVETSLRLIGP